MRWFRKTYRDFEIAPDEIFLDASAAGDFDRSQFEGRLEQPLSSATYTTVGVLLVLVFFTLVIRAGDLQIVRGAMFAEVSAHNSLSATTLIAPRGIITDRNGIPLAENVAQPDGSVYRMYPYPEMGQIIGYVSRPKKDSSGRYYDTEITGIAGLEAMYNAELAGTNGSVLVEKDALGKVRSQGALVPPIDGKTLQLSIDANMERLFASAIGRAVRDNKFVAGAGVIMDVHTGAVVAIVSFPSYDPNVLSAGTPASIINSYNSDPGHPFLDHAVQGTYAPGSIVKPLISSGALTDGIITPSTIINDPGKLVVPDPYHPGQNFVYTGWKALGPVDVRSAIAWSSDIFFYTVGGGFGSQKGLGIDRLDYWYDQYGLGKPTGIDLPGEASGLVPTPAWKEATLHEPWYLGDTYFTAIGQYSMQVTPIQMARATAAVANGGKLLTPTLIKDQPPVWSKVPVTSDSLQVVREGMREGVTEALARALDLPYLSVAAKTGTAQVGVNNEFDNAWVEGFFPYENPRYSFAVVLERGPAGVGEKAVTTMRTFFDALKAQQSPYVGGTGTTTIVAP